ncbi:MAG: hypothetical protein Ta2B_27980 [Termitinemataceae bacterium]|nr:MAG: hypothetical protein Ta2B_27980 [Termitinemataceae bacterium]
MGLLVANRQKYYNGDMSTLIAGSRSNLFSAIYEEYKSKAEECVTALIPAINSNNSITSSTFDWNPASPISARTLLLSAINKMQKIDNAIVVVTAPTQIEAHNLTAPNIEHIVDNYIKGPLFLFREIQIYFRCEKKGTLSLVLQEETENMILCSPVSAAWSAFVRSALDTSQSEPYKTLGFNCTVNKLDQILDFAVFLHKTIKDTRKIESGKLLKYKKLPF